MSISKLSINQDVLKLVALVTMTIDHIAKYIFDVSSTSIFIGIGRISFPIFAFLLMKHLANRQIFSKYVIRLGVFGGITVALSCFFKGVVKVANVFPLNILISFFVAVLFLMFCNFIKKEKGPEWIKILMLGFNFLCFSLLSSVCDYGVIGFCFLVLIYFYFMMPNKMVLFLVILFSGLINIGDNFWWVGILTLLVLLFNDYSKKNDRIFRKWWWFYVYYPLHLFVIGWISYYMQ